MSRYLRTLTVMASLWAATTTHAPLAEIYKSVDENGNVIFTDSPKHKSAKPVDLPTINTQPATPITIKLSPPKDEEVASEDAEYSIAMTAPTDETTVTRGQLTLASSISLKPSLQDGHKIQFFLDGLKRGPASTSTSYTYQDLYRGTHTIYAAVVNKKGKIIKQSEPITIYVHRPLIQSSVVTYGQI